MDPFPSGSLSPWLALTSTSYEANPFFASPFSSQPPLAGGGILNPFVALPVEGAASTTISPDALLGVATTSASSSSPGLFAPPPTGAEAHRDSVASSSGSARSESSYSTRPSTPEPVVSSAGVSTRQQKRTRSNSSANYEEVSAPAPTLTAGGKKRRPRKMTDKRREQNRLAQKNLRARRAAQYEHYHDRVDGLEKENAELRSLIEALREENASLRSTGTGAGLSVSTPALLGLGRTSFFPDTDYTCSSHSDDDDAAASIGSPYSHPFETY